MRIIIPMAGIGSRLKPHTLTVPKPLTPIAGKPIVQRLVEEINRTVSEPVEEIGFIIGPASKGFPSGTGNRLKQIAGELGAGARIFVQEQALGTAHAIYQAREMLDGKCVVAFADTLFKADFSLDPAADGVIWVHKVDNPESFGVVQLDDSGAITGFVEKPDVFVSDLAIIGIYYFKDAAVLRNEIEYLINNGIRGKGGEYQLTDALEAMKNKGLRFLPGTVNDWMDNGNKDVAVQTNAKILEYAAAEGEKLIAADLVRENAGIIPPCYIGEGVRLKNSTIGPHVSIGAGTVVENSHIRNSLIQNNSLIKNARLANSMIGNNVVFDGNFDNVSLGDFSQLTVQNK